MGLLLASLNLLSSLIDPSTLHYLVSVSSPEVVSVDITKTFHSSNNTVSYTVGHYSYLVSGLG